MDLTYIYITIFLLIISILMVLALIRKRRRRGQSIDINSQYSKESRVMRVEQPRKGTKRSTTQQPQQYYETPESIQITYDHQIITQKHHPIDQTEPEQWTQQPGHFIPLDQPKPQSQSKIQPAYEHSEQSQQYEKSSPGVYDPRPAYMKYRKDQQ
jgi:FtsZ-interacting cell division protein ZipA